MTKPKLIVPKHVWDGKAVEKQKKELEKVPNPSGYRITLFPLKLDSKTKSGIILTDDTVQESQLTTNICKVLKVGPDAYKDKKKFPHGAYCKEGEWVIISKYAGTRIKLADGEIRILNDDEILGTILEPTDVFTI